MQRQSGYTPNIGWSNGQSSKRGHLWVSNKSDSWKMGGGLAEVLKLGETSLIFVSWGNNLTSFTLLVASDSLLLLQEVLDVAALRQKVLQRVSKRRVVAIGVPVCAHKMLTFGYFLVLQCTKPSIFLGGWLTMLTGFILKQSLSAQIWRITVFV